MTASIPKLISTCKLCKQTFTASAFDVEIIGQPNARLFSFMNGLTEHLRKRHPETTAAIGMFSACIAAQQFELTDPNLLAMREKLRHQLHRMTRRTYLSDADIMERVSRLDFTDSQKDGLAYLLRDMRDVLCEEGGYAPKEPETLPPAAPF